MKIIITGFGPFGSIKENPASIVAEKVAQALRAKNVNIVFKQIITSIEDVLDFYNNLNEKNVFVVHVGVYDSSLKPQIETQGHNLADFPIPDVHGNQPRTQKIVKNLELGQAINQCFDFKTIIPPDTDIEYSTDAGDYICNYCFVQALMNVGKKTVGATFIHIPSFTEYSLEKSVETLSKVVFAIASNPNKFNTK